MEKGGQRQGVTEEQRRLGEGPRCHSEPPTHPSPTLSLAPAFNAEGVAACLRRNL